MTEPTDDAPAVRLEAMGRDNLGRDAAPWLGPVRLAVGLLQGLGLFWLHRVSDEGIDWPATQPLLFGPLLLVFAFLPVMLLAGIGRLRLRTLAVWGLVAGAGLALLGLHDIARQSADTLLGPPFLSPPVILFSAAALFIAHHLVAPADMERRRLASFPAYFDTATKSLVQLALSIGFTGAFWALLHLGAALFRVIGLDFLEDLLREDWFYIPITFFVFAIAVHLTDVRDGLIRGVRTVALMLLSWLLLVMTVVVAGFVAALPFTGLQGLWETGNATALVLAAAGALIVLILAAYQDGRADNRPPMILRIAVRIAAVLITPLIVIAFWGLALRIGQHGLTPDRIIAAACALVGAAIALGYGWAAVSPFWRRGEWMRPLERTTIAAAALALILILTLFSPLADPARLSVADQMARLERGAVTPDEFDYRFLRFESGKAGQAALARLARSSNPETARLAKAMQAERSRYDVRVRGEQAAPVIESWPVGTALPVDFLASANRVGPTVSCAAAGDCVATRRDLNGDGKSEIVLARRSGASIFEQTDGGWRLAANYEFRGCRRTLDPRAALKTGRLMVGRSPWPALALGDGEPVSPEVNEACPPGSPAAAGDEEHGRLTSR
ncbi:FG-GAP repeat domain-containing protein [Brevundimonas sp.]|uniref:FG-GAP repeat domain-containing protein n=1 Tax=Brevundimonas sp. TaxID=1871086 RepID=UPI002EDBAA99